MPPPMSSRQDTYGVFPENVMSGRVELLDPFEIGAPSLTSSKCAVAPLPTSRETKIWFTPRMSSSHATHGTVALAGFIVPAATRGFSAFPSGFLLSEHWDSFTSDSAHLPKPWRPVVSSVPLS